MKRRLYFLLPDVASATRAANDLLLARVEDRHMHFLAKRGTALGELHEAGYLFKTDLVRGAGIGLALGVLRRAPLRGGSSAHRRRTRRSAVPPSRDSRTPAAALDRAGLHRYRGARAMPRPARRSRRRERRTAPCT